MRECCVTDHGFTTTNSAIKCPNTGHIMINVASNANFYGRKRAKAKRSYSAPSPIRHSYISKEKSFVKIS
ncbi:hypothetical protein KTT_44360 [Tengunoibacter tsumagoiensis]|uniref:Uncharacterized protein n=1 Tax=Tengunoibacter tsumagoiensis TaxID=2014871 RepID=A0A402A600_9CHLR|nr:hypothetical protein KTT_44360 [Tengunoibacter tsumagoiensis]